MISQVFTTGLVANLLDRIRMSPSGYSTPSPSATVSACTEPAMPPPVTVPAEMLGLPVQDQPLFRGRAEDLVRHSVARLPSPEDTDTPDLAPGEMEIYLLHRIVEVRSAPDDELVSTMVDRRIGDDQLSDTTIAGGGDPAPDRRSVHYDGAGRQQRRGTRADRDG